MENPAVLYDFPFWTSIDAGVSTGFSIATFDSPARIPFIHPGGRCPALGPKGEDICPQVVLLQNGHGSSPYNPNASKCSMYGIFTIIYLHDWVIFRANVGKYYIHGAYDYGHYGPFGVCGPKKLWHRYRWTFEASWGDKPTSTNLDDLESCSQQLDGRIRPTPRRMRVVCLTVSHRLAHWQCMTALDLKWFEL